MINSEKMIEYLIEASPSFGEKWLKFLHEWRDEKEHLSYNLILGAYARHIKSVFDSKNEEALIDIFDMIENIYLKGDENVKQAIIIGLIEDLQNISASQKGGARVYEKYLLPETKYWWDKVSTLWG